MDDNEGCFAWAFLITWSIVFVVTIAFWVVVIWAIIAVVSGLDQNCFNELGEAVACP